MAQYIDVEGAVVFPQKQRGAQNAREAQKLRGADNYKEWNRSMKNFLSDTLQVWDTIEAENQDEKKNASALHAILINCESHVLPKIRNAKTARDAWNILGTSYGPIQNIIITSSIVPERLRGDRNYEEWTLCMKNFLLSTDLWYDVIIDRPLDQQANSGQPLDLRNDKALRAIQITCDPPAFSKIKNAKTARDAWNILAASYAQPLESNGDEENLNLLFKYADKGDWEHMKRHLLDGNSQVCKFGSRGLTALHIAAMVGNLEMVKRLVDALPQPPNVRDPSQAPTVDARSYLAIQDAAGFTALHYVAVRGNKPMAESIIQVNDALVGIANNASCLPVTLACKYKHREMSEFLYSKTKDLPSRVLCAENGKYGSLFIQDCIRSRMTDLAVQALDDHCGPDDRLVAARYPGTQINSLLETLSRASGKLKSSQGGLGHWLRRWICTCSGRTHPCHDAILEKMHDYLQTLTAKRCYELGIEQAFDQAVSLGAVEVIDMLLDICPLLINRRNVDGRDLIMTSIVNRHEKVFSIYYRIEGTYGIKAEARDKNGNTLLHLAGMLSPPSVLTLRSGAALQMQRELQWYKEVERILHLATKFRLNNAGKTPKEVFSEKHKELVKEGEQWMKNTATSSTVVGALIITVVFAAAFTIPGGSLADIGIPVFLHKKAFKIFMVSDAISLFAASTSVLMFLGILTSRYEEKDFLESLPRKLIIGLSTLFISIVAMMVAFCAALQITLHGTQSIIITIFGLACIPAILFLLLQCPLLFDIFKSTYFPDIFDRKRKPRLYK